MNSKLPVLLFFLILLFGCSKEKSKLEGTKWQGNFSFQIANQPDRFNVVSADVYYLNGWVPTLTIISGEFEGYVLFQDGKACVSGKITNYGWEGYYNNAMYPQSRVTVPGGYGISYSIPYIEQDSRVYFCDRNKQTGQLSEYIYEFTLNRMGPWNTTLVYNYAYGDFTKM